MISSLLSPRCRIFGQRGNEIIKSTVTTFTQRGETAERCKDQYNFDALRPVSQGTALFATMFRILRDPLQIHEGADYIWGHRAEALRDNE